MFVNRITVIGQIRDMHVMQAALEFDCLLAIQYGAFQVVVLSVRHPDKMTFHPELLASALYFTSTGLRDLATCSVFRLVAQTPLYSVSGEQKQQDGSDKGCGSG